MKNVFGWVLMGAAVVLCFAAIPKSSQHACNHAKATLCDHCIHAGTIVEPENYYDLLNLDLNALDVTCRVILARGL